MMASQFHGDTGKFRAALLAAGFLIEANSNMFNDKAKVRGYRRIKLWFADRIQSSTQAKQIKLCEELKKQFGKRFQQVYLWQTANYLGARWSLCVRLEN